MRLLALLPIFLGIAGSLGNANGATPSKSDLIGNWEEDPGTCEGDNGISYRSNGSFSGYDYEGRWKLTGETLTTFITKQMDPDDEKWRRVKTPEQEVSTIVSLTRERLIERWVDGSLHHFHRCR